MAREEEFILPGTPMLKELGGAANLKYNYG